jgi:hypothetical protein
VHPGLESIKDWLRFRLPDFDAPVRRRSTRLLLNGIEPRDPPDDFIGDGRTLGRVDKAQPAMDCGYLDEA